MTAEAVPEHLVELVDRARSVRENAYARYSGYHVGAALRTSSGALFVGCNVENATYGATICAERTAVVSMVAAGERRIEAIAVFSDGNPLALPCGICRQVLSEFARPEAMVVAASPSAMKVTTLGALFPDPFVLAP